MTILLPPISGIALPASQTVIVSAADNKALRQYLPSTGAALCIYLLINLVLQLLVPHLTGNDHWSRTAHSAIAQFNGLPKRVPIAFVGSSVMGRPIWCVDHAHYQVVPYPDHRRMKWLPNELAKAGYGDVPAFNFSLDASMVSDVYLVCDKLFKDGHLPDLVVYGMNRRDVLGCLFLCERTTPSFKLFFEPSDCAQLSHLYSASAKERFELVLGQLVPVYRYRQLFQDNSYRQLQHARNLVLTLPKAETTATSDRSSGQNQDSANESLPITKDMGNFTTYSMDKARLKNQETVLKMMAAVIAKRHSHMLIVNMPLRKDFLSAAKPICTNYEETLQACAGLPNTFVLDLEKADLGVDNDCFEDWFHLNAKGGEKVLRRIVDWIKEHKENLKFTDAGAS